MRCSIMRRLVKKHLEAGDYDKIRRSVREFRSEVFTYSKNERDKASVHPPPLFWSTKDEKIGSLFSLFSHV